MSYLINNEQKLNDIIFADRNKAYGAYAIRSSYGNTVFRSLSFMLIGVGTVMSFAFYLSHKNPPPPEENYIPLIPDTTVFTLRVDLEKEKIESSGRKPDAPAPPETRHNYNMVKQIVDSVLIAQKTNTAAVETNSVPVTDLLHSIVTGSTGSVGGAEGPDTMRIAKGKTKQQYEVDTPPEYEGGLEALYRFVAGNLKYPYRASSEGKSGTVYVKFIVDENGNVGSLDLQNNIGYGMDEEAFRVVSIIPKFKSPAKVKGEPVKVYYQLPIRFKYR